MFAAPAGPLLAHRRPLPPPPFLPHRCSAMASTAAPPRAQRGWADLPGDVLRRVAGHPQELPPQGRHGPGGDEPARDAPLLLREMLSAAAACTAWRRALASPHLESLTIGGAM